MKRILVIIIAGLLVNMTSLLSQESLKPKQSKKVNLSEYGYPVMLYCTLPPGAEVKKEYESYSIKLGENLSIESISWYNKNGYDWDTHSHFKRSASKMFKDFKDNLKQKQKFKNYKIIKEYENGIYAVESANRNESQRLIFYYESVEQVYEVKCDPIFPYKEREFDLIMDVINSIEAIPYCFDEVKKVGPNDFIHDFSEFGLAIKIPLSSHNYIESKRYMENYRLYHSIYDIILKEGKKYISLFQYTLPNEIDVSFPRRKEEIQNDPRFIRMIHDDPNGFLAELQTSDYERDRYVFYYYYKTDSYFYKFESCRENIIGESRVKLEPMTLDLALEAYSRVKSIQIGKVCN